MKAAETEAAVMAFRRSIESQTIVIQVEPTRIKDEFNEHVRIGYSRLHEAHKLRDVRLTFPLVLLQLNGPEPST